MSFYSYIRIFQPGRPPVISLGELRAICDTLRETFSLEDDFHMLNISYQHPEGSWGITDWDKTGTVAINRRTPRNRGTDYARESSVWQKIWPDDVYNDKTIYRAFIGLGNLSESTNIELSLSDLESVSPSYISPTEMFISIGPVELGTLTAELPKEECYGFMSISFSGYGYFTWQPLEAYWKVIRQSASIQKALQLCRRVFPASHQIDVHMLKNRLGEMFLNHEEYQPGDWIVSVSESG